LLILRRTIIRPTVILDIANRILRICRLGNLFVDLLLNSRIWFSSLSPGSRRIDMDILPIVELLYREAWLFGLVFPE
jgi:hypothetical protein